MDPSKWIQEAFLESHGPTTAPDDAAEKPTAGFRVVQRERVEIGGKTGVRAVIFSRPVSAAG
jgi:hypothetical protein